MPGSMVIPCVGASDPLIREYVHDFGLAAWNVVALEDHLKLLLKDMAVLRAKWPLRARKLEAIAERLEEATLGGLITQYERLGGNRDLIANLRPLNATRRLLLHRRIPLTPLGESWPDRARIAELRTALQAYSSELLGRSNAIQKAHHAVFDELVARVRSEQPPDLPGMISLHALLSRNERMVRNHPDA